MRSVRIAFLVGLAVFVLAITIRYFAAPFHGVPVATEILAQAIGEPRSPAQVLNYRMERGPHGLVVESAIVIAQYDSGFTLHHAYRHPLETRSNVWHEYALVDAEYVSLSTFPTLPSAEQIREFLVDSD